MSIKLAPSLLSADFSRLGEQMTEVAEAGAEYIHLDIMDGHFVPNITIGSPVVESLRKSFGTSAKPVFDVHLMVTNPEDQIPLFAEAGADILTIHVEACAHLHRAVEHIRKLGCKAGVSLNPGTPATALEAILPDIDLVLVMTVDPGYGGQPFIEGMVPKIEEVRRELDRIGSAAELEVDGGITAELAPRVVQAGATVLVAGAAVFKHPEGPGRAVALIREKANRNR